MKHKRCIKCGVFIPPPVRQFCPNCGTDQFSGGGPVLPTNDKKCVKCRKAIFPPDAMFCNHCGANQRTISGR